MKLLLSIAGLALALHVQTATQPPAGATPLIVAQGRGVQIYRCDAQGQTFDWTFQAPDAELFDPATGAKLGVHGAGPSWTWKDGSSILGTVLEKQPSPDAGSIPWLLLTASPTGSVHGTLGAVTFVRRSDTQGGIAPTKGCDQAHKGMLARIPYTATYTFYTHGR